MNIILIIKNFKKFTSRTFKFRISGVVKLSGVSGSGKSTVIKAIAWCLYDIDKNNVIPYSIKKAKTISNNTKVSIQFSEGILCNESIVICRSKHPNKITIKIGNYQYENKEAQQKIIELFGDEKIWCASSYLEQKKQNLFLNMVQNDKLAFLSSLVFVNEEESKNIRDKTQREIKKYDNIIECSNAVITSKIKTITSKYESAHIYDYDVENILANEVLNKLRNYHDINSCVTCLQRIDINLLENEIETFQEEIVYSENKQKNVIKIKTEINLQDSQIDDYSSKIIDLEDQYNNFINEINILQLEFEKEKDTSEETINSKKQELDRINSLLVIRNKIDRLTWYDPSLIIDNNILSNFILIDNVKSRLVNLGIKEFNNDNELKALIINSMKSLKDIIDSQEYINLSKQFYKFNTKYQELLDTEFKDVKIIPVFEDVSVEKPDFSKIDSQITIHEKNLQEMYGDLKKFELVSSIYTCPSCNDSLSLCSSSGKLIKFSKNINKDSYEFLKKKIKVSQEIIQSLKIEKKKIQDEYDIKFRKMTTDREKYINEKNKLENENKDIIAFNVNLQRMIDKYDKLVNDILQKLTNIATNNKITLDDLDNFYINKIEFDEVKLRKISYNYSSLKTILDEIERNKDINFSSKSKLTLQQMKDQNDFQMIIKSTSFTKDEILDPSLIVNKKRLENEIQDINYSIRRHNEKTNRIRFIESKKNHVEAQLAILRGQYEICSKNYNKLISENGDIVNCSIDEMSDEINNLRDYLRILYIIKDLHIEYLQVCKMTIDREEKLLYLQKLYEYRDFVKYFQHELFTSKINQLNELINKICSNFFDNEFIVEMKVMKENNEKEKPNIYFQITIDGIKTDDLKSLSGGELDRFSLAMTLAFRMLVPNNPFILLDENIASIDKETKIKVINFLRNICNDKVILCVIHDSIDAYFDDEIKIE